MKSGHGFDDQGRKVDATGAVRDWWTKTDADRFDAQALSTGADPAHAERFGQVVAAVPERGRVMPPGSASIRLSVPRVSARAGPLAPLA
jgi:hypothetical protein